MASIALPEEGDDLLVPLAIGDEWLLPMMRATCRVTRPIEVAGALVTIRVTPAGAAATTAEVLLPLARIDERWYLAGDLRTTDGADRALAALLIDEDAGDEADDEDAADDDAEEDDAADADARAMARRAEEAEAERARVFQQADERCAALVRRLNAWLPADQQLGDAAARQCVKQSQADYLCMAGAASLEAAAACKAGLTEAECTALATRLYELATDPEEKARRAPDHPSWAGGIASCRALTSAAEHRCKMAAPTLEQTYLCSSPMHSLP